MASNSREGSTSSGVKDKGLNRDNNSKTGKIKHT